MWVLVCCGEKITSAANANGASCRSPVAQNARAKRGNASGGPPGMRSSIGSPRSKTWPRRTSATALRTSSGPIARQRAEVGEGLGHDRGTL